MAQPAQGKAATQFLYLVQHGEAKPETEDPDRPLTDLGRQAVERVADWTARAGIRIDQVRHSGKLRAKQTAAIFAEKLQPKEGIAVLSNTGPHDDPQPAAALLDECPGAVMLVGHLPFLNRLAGLLLADDTDCQVIRFCYGGIVGLVREEGRWSIGCFVPPQWT
jgi:phosphohistidine phosphatase